jgi:hypothetical protein
LLPAELGNLPKARACAQKAYKLNDPLESLPLTLLSYYAVNGDRQKALE